MQILVKLPQTYTVVNIEEGMTIASLQRTIRLMSHLPSFTLPYSSETAVASIYKDMATISALPMMVGGGKNMTEAGKALAVEAITCLICRNCYAKNPIGASHCRKQRCRRSNLRPKKIATKKK
ncbi:ubiquitin-large subunit ribosomal protein L40e [Pancytospora epiphaga]|nr:ubiquitin-large subunit ribosomal protein L40e [Pancytospora epiphaga]